TQRHRGRTPRVFTHFRRIQIKPVKRARQGFVHAHHTFELAVDTEAVFPSEAELKLRQAPFQIVEFGAGFTHGIAPSLCSTSTISRSRAKGPSSNSASSGETSPRRTFSRPCQSIVRPFRPAGESQ